MFNILDPLAVISSLMLLETPLQRYLRVRGSMRVEDTNIKKTLFIYSTPGSMSSLAPSVVLVDLPVNTSAVKV